MSKKPPRQTHLSVARNVSSIQRDNIWRDGYNTAIRQCNQSAEIILALRDYAELVRYIDIMALNAPKTRLRQLLQAWLKDSGESTSTTLVTAWIKVETAMKAMNIDFAESAPNIRDGMLARKEALQDIENGNEHGIQALIDIAHNANDELDEYRHKINKDFRQGNRESETTTYLYNQSFKYKKQGKTWRKITESIIADLEAKQADNTANSVEIAAYTILNTRTKQSATAYLRKTYHQVKNRR